MDAGFAVTFEMLSLQVKVNLTSKCGGNLHLKFSYFLGDIKNRSK
jgi:hypothetical protein